jgi:hypothetical protein
VLNLKMYYSSNALVLPPYPLEDAAKEIFLFLWPRSAETGRKNKPRRRSIHAVEEPASRMKQPPLSLNDRIQLQFRTWPSEYIGIFGNQWQLGTIDK